MRFVSRPPAFLRPGVPSPRRPFAPAALRPGGPSPRRPFDALRPLALACALVPLCLSGPPACRATPQAQTPVHSSVLSVSPTPMAGGGGGTDPGGGGTATRPIPYVQLNGPLDVDGSRETLTGLNVSATVWLPPLAANTSVTYAWTITTTTGGSSHVFKDYTDVNSDHCHLVSLSSRDMSQASLSFYDSASENLSVQCFVTYTADTGHFYAENATAAMLTVVKPSVSWGITTGIARSNAVELPNGNHIVEYGLFPTAATFNNGIDAPGGVYWHDVTVTVPAPFSGGTCCFTQLVTPDHESGGISGTNNSVSGLDNSFEYYGYTWNPSPSPAGTEKDSPAFQPPLNKPAGYVITYHDSFHTWVMYKPTGGIWVPLNMYSYDWGITLTSTGSAWNMSGQNPDPPKWDLIHMNQ